MARVPQASLGQNLKDRALRHLRAHGETMGMDMQEMNSAPLPVDWQTRSGADAVSGLECRFVGATGLELRAGAGQSRADLPAIVGYASVFDSPTFIGGPGGGFTEVVKRGAFTKTITSHDIRALFNHDENLVLGRTDSGTLRLSEDSHGLRMEIDPPNTSMGRDVVEMVRRGDVSGASFGFTPVKQAWARGENGEPDRRELLEVRLFDVSPVTFPAYAEAEVASRALSWARRGLSGGPLTSEELQMVTRLLPAWATHDAQQRSTHAPGGASTTSVQGPPEPGATTSFEVRRQRQEALEAELGLSGRK